MSNFVIVPHFNIIDMAVSIRLLPSSTYILMKKHAAGILTFSSQLRAGDVRCCHPKYYRETATRSIYRRSAT